MKELLPLFCIALLGCVSVPETKFNGKRLPPHWRISEVIHVSAPYGWSARNEKSLGVAVTFEGPKKVSGPRRIKRRESFTVWIMPSEDEPTQENYRVQFAASKILGSNDTVTVYCMSSWKPISWGQWQTDMIERLNLRKEEP